MSRKGPTLGQAAGGRARRIRPSKTSMGMAGGNMANRMPMRAPMMQGPPGMQPMQRPMPQMPSPQMSQMSQPPQGFQPMQGNVGMGPTPNVGMGPQFPSQQLSPQMHQILQARGTPMPQMSQGMMPPQMPGRM